LDYNRGSHCKYLLMTHLIFVVKYRRKLLSFFNDDIRLLMFEIAEYYGWDILEYMMI